VKVGFCCSKVGIVGLFSYVNINKSGKKKHTFKGAAAAKVEMLTRFFEV